MQLSAVVVADPEILPTVATLTYGIVTIAAGVALCWMGYQLFRVGIYEKGGDLNASWGSKKIALKQAGPGTFFALFGAAVLGLAVHKGMSITVPIAADLTVQHTASMAGGQTVSSSTDNSKPAVQVTLPTPPASSGIAKIIQKVNYRPDPGRN